MPVFYSVLNDGKRLARLTAGRKLYRMSGGRAVAVDEIAAWCHKCKAFTLAERIRTLDHERADLADTFWRTRGDVDNTAFMRDAARCFVDRRINERKEWFDYLPNRKSPPRCLRCGSDEIIPLAERSIPFPNPVGPGMLTVHFTWMSATSCGWSDETITYYSPEGKKLE